MITVDTPRSGVLKSFTYHHSDHVLEVVFRSGATYTYFAVPQHIVDDMVAATQESVGQFFTRYVRDEYSYAIAPYPRVPLPDNVVSLRAVRNALNAAQPDWFKSNIEINLRRTYKLQEERRANIKKILARDKSTKYPDGWR